MLYVLLIVLTIGLALKIALIIVDNISRHNQRATIATYRIDKLLHSDNIARNIESRTIHLQYICNDISIVAEHLQRKLHPEMDDDTKFFMTVFTVDC
jgi:hypothetical protein